MASEFDIVIRGGSVMDGNGGTPFTADVAVKDGRIAEIGKVDAGGREEIDAAGLSVTPGWVDLHTHYDGQAIWDSRLAPSSWHGVTTVVMGNCGVGFAPVRKNTQTAVIALMEGVEDIPGPCLHEGLDWTWESFGEYLTALERRPHDIDFCALLPHAPLRVYVMGERALRLEDANQSDIRQMRELAAEAVKAGAFGFSTSRTIAHKTLAGDATPTLRAQEAELTGIALGLKDAGKGFIEMTSDWNTPDPATEFSMLRRVMAASGRPLVLSLTQRHDGTTAWKDLLELTTEAVAEGVPVRCVAPPRPIGALLGLTGSQNPFAGTRTYHEIAHLPLPERLARMRDPAVRARIVSEDPHEFNTWSLLGRIGWERMFRFTDPVNYTPAKEDSIAAIAARQGRTPQDVAYDMLIEDDGKGFIFTCLVNYANYDLSAVKEMYGRDHVIPGLSDGGAHVAFISDASFPTFLFSYWGRDRGEDRLPLHDLVRRQTREPARFAGLHDRGVLAPGMKADINVIDFPNLGLERPRMVVDLPAGGRRLMQKAYGYVATVKAGQVIYRNGVATGALPGGLVRSTH
ncbi:N-acyl-D-amino-acid deacylase family protein [Rhodopila sp.]|jgi:N-acyl-D-aspartate/D-glutamate deacylase|uniref:N-acyl-D-amino-acid deacylase family protein n=1 Tax=Rhodopila sp. TaxID=2480087 RepID=UPI002C42DB90|nr:amidohydrolase family protein [Rhodopila sp.]HVZ07021.1 amidohydrolase family protein [Rhodopila sp.]